MTSLRQIEANRRNALRSTGPRTEQGKRLSRANAIRHGLTAETIVTSVEDAEDYKAFEAAVIADYNARTAVERELVLRLASLLWRLRRATAVETDLLQIQAENLRDRQLDRAGVPESGRSSALSGDQAVHLVPLNITASNNSAIDVVPTDHALATRKLTYCFLRLANLDSAIFERLGRYEAALWRQTVQLLLTLRAARGEQRANSAFEGRL